MISSWSKCRPHLCSANLHARNTYRYLSLHRRNNGYRIHPALLKRLVSTASSDETHPLRIADVATGSGAWALDVARSFPSTKTTPRIDGYDIADMRFPTNPPQSVTFSVQDAKEPFPSELHGVYDLVHVRALVAAMDHSDWLLVAKNLIALLKPGGAMQWTEADLANMACLRDGEATEEGFKAIPYVLDLFNEAAHGRTAYGPRELAGVLKEAGLKDVKVDAAGSDRIARTRAALTRTYLVAMLAWAKSVGKVQEDEVTTLRKQIAEEIDSGAYARGDIFTTFGVK